MTDTYTVVGYRPSGYHSSCGEVDRSDSALEFVSSTDQEEVVQALLRIKQDTDGNYGRPEYEAWEVTLLVNGKIVDTNVYSDEDYPYWTKFNVLEQRAKVLFKAWKEKTKNEMILAAEARSQYLKNSHREADLARLAELKARYPEA